jgi:hypothetical protein
VRFEFIGDAEVADPVSYGAGHPWSLCLEESSSLGSGGIFGRGSGGKSGSVATSSLRANARPKRPIAIKITPPIISQCGNAIDESKRIYLPLDHAAKKSWSYQRLSAITALTISNIMITQIKKAGRPSGIT